MELTAIAKIYWRTIKRGTRSCESVKDEAIKAILKNLAKSDVISGTITEEQYFQLIGETYA